MRAEEETYMTKLIAAFRNFANVPKNVNLIAVGYRILLTAVFIHCVIKSPTLAGMTPLSASKEETFCTKLYEFDKDAAFAILCGCSHTRLINAN
jgi:membrane-bound metal-dependent hydrolase YbcI (DUF457 family)